MIGLIIGKLTVVKKAPNIIGKAREYSAWECLCSCGNTKIVSSANLSSKQTTSCGCLKLIGKSSIKPGEKFGRLTAISYKRSKWFCICDCGQNTEIKSSALKHGNTKSCGCLNIEVASNKAYKLIESRRKFEPRIASARRIWKNYCYRDKKCTITFEEFISITQKKCFYCNVDPNTKYNYFSTRSSNSSKKAKLEGLFIYNGMYRIDSGKYYTIDNIVTCCYDCEFSKGELLTAKAVSFQLNLLV